MGSEHECEMSAVSGILGPQSFQNGFVWTLTRGANNNVGCCIFYSLQCEGRDYTVHTFHNDEYAHESHIFDGTDILICGGKREHRMHKDG